MRKHVEESCELRGDRLSAEIVDYISSRIVPDGMGRSVRAVCPACSPDRKKKNERTLSITVNDDHALYMCWHCDEKGRVNFKGDGLDLDYDFQEAEIVPINSAPKDLDVEYGPPTEEYVKWLEAHRGISPETTLSSDVVCGDVWIRSKGEITTCVGFKYTHIDGSKAIKWRDLDKNFTQTGSAKELWGIQHFDEGDLVICEGEIDALSYREIGVFAVSVPSGAPSKPSTGISSRRYDYLMNAREKIEKADRIIIATDNDEPGKILAEEIVRRVGRGKCWVVSYDDDCKDANEVLTKKGAEALSSTLIRATPWPVSGIRDAKEFRSIAMSLYENGMDRGISMGIPDLDKVYRVNPQTLTILTGIPGSGKSSFLTWLSVNLASRTGWGSVIMSAETPTEVHVLQMASVYLGKPFDGQYKMNKDELEVALDWVQNNFTFLDTSDTSINSVMERAAISIMRTGARIVQIDPYNFLTTAEDGAEGVLQINKLLVGLKRFAEDHDCAVILCAHPTKMYRAPDGKVPSPSGYDVAGSSAFFNIADAGLTVDRMDDGISKLRCWKARFPWIGSIGDCDMAFNPLNGNFSVNFEGRIANEKTIKEASKTNFDDFDF